MAISPVSVLSLSLCLSLLLGTQRATMDSFDTREILSADLRCNDLSS